MDLCGFHGFGARLDGARSKEQGARSKEQHWIMDLAGRRKEGARGKEQVFYGCVDFIDSWGIWCPWLDF